MNIRTTNKLAGTLLALGALAISAQAAPISGGDVIKLDFSTSGDADGGSLADWNQVHGNLNQTGISAGNVKLHGGGTVDGVTISFTNLRTGSFNNDGAAGGWGGTAADPYYILAADDIYYHNVAADFGVTFSGLDDSLSYNLRSYTLIGNNGGTVYTYSVSDGGGVQNYSGTNASRWTASTLEAAGTVFSDLQTDGAGSITVTYSSPNAFAMNAIVLEAIDEGPDITPPTIMPPTSPADEASGVVASSDLVATFDENIALTGAGTVTIRDLGAGPDVVIDLSDPGQATQVSVTGKDLTISPASDLLTSNNYAIQISADAVVDLAATPNAFAGILDDTTWNFQTAADGTAPTIMPPTSPADGASDVAVDTTLVATFDETVAAGSGNITIKNISEGTETVIPVGDSRVSVSGMGLTIALATDLNPADDYAIRIDPGAVTDTTGNPFAGIGDDTTWNFTTAADTTAPTLVFPTIPEDEATGVTAGSLVATFSEPIMATAATVLHNWDFESDGDGFTLKTAGGGYTPEGSAWERGTPGSISPGGTVDSGNGAASGTGGCWGTNLGLADDGAYVVPTVTCLRSPVIDLRGVAGAQLSFAEALDLEVDDTAVVNIIEEATDKVIAPAIYTADDSGGEVDANWNTVPAIDLADGIGQLVRIEWCFSGGTDQYLGWYIDDIQVTTTTAASSITIKNLTTATETSIAVSDSSQVSIAGNDLTVTPNSGFEFNSDYAIQIGPSAITDLSGNPFAGIGDDTTWNFATEVAVPIAAGTKIGLAPGPTPTDDTGNDWFDFSASNTTYNVIHNLDGDIVDGVSVQVAGSVGFNLAGENNWVGLSSEGGSAPAEFVDSVTTDLMFNDATITIRGLDPALSYDITTVSHGGGASYDSRVDAHTITGDISYGTSSHTRGEARLTGKFHSFPDVSPDPSGTIVLMTLQQPSGGNAAFNGLLLEAKDPAAAGYAGWAGLFAGFTNTAADADPEGDGLASGVEWVVDGDPTANDGALVAPTFDNTTDPDDFLFTFRRRDDAAADPATTIVVEYGSDLTGWTPTEAGWLMVVDDGFGTSAIDGVGVDKVTVAIPRSLAVDGKLFARLNVTITP